MPSSTPSVPPPILLQVSELSERMQRPNLVLVDLRTAELYSQGHLPGAQRLDYASIVRQNPPIGGLLPSPAEFNLQLQRLGVENDSHIVAYDGTTARWRHLGLDRRWQYTQYRTPYNRTITNCALSDR